MNFARVYGMATCAVVAFTGCGDDRVESTSNTLAADTVVQPAAESAVAQPHDGRAGAAITAGLAHEANAGVIQSILISLRSVCRRVAEERPPHAVDDTLTVDEDKTGTVNVLANDSDPDGDPLTATITVGPAHGTATIANGVVSYKSASNYNGADSLTYRINDGRGGLATATVTVVVRPVNDRPVAMHDFLTVASGTTGTVNVLANDSDPDGDVLTVTAHSAPGHGTVSFAGGVASYTPAAGFSGSDTFEYTISDGKLTSTASVFITVTAATSDAPVAVDDTLTTAEDTEGDVFVLGNDSDPDGGTLTVTAFDQPANGTVSITAGIAAYLPAANYNGPDSFHYTVRNASGATSTATVFVTVVAVDDAPVASDDAASLDEDTSATIDVVANDRDIDRDPLVVASVTQPAHGSATIVSAHEVRYTPAANFHGSDSFTYSVADPSGATASATVTLSITSVNDAPVAVADSATVDQDTSATIDVVANDSDPDHDPLTVTSATAPGHGTAVVVDATHVVYTPAANYRGPDSFSYTISDGNGGEASAAVAISVAPVNHAPVATDDAAATDEDTAVTIDVVANDSDRDGDPLTVVAVTAASRGTVVISDAHHVTYTPGADLNGSDSFSYTIDDGAGGQATATVAISVAPVNDAPIAHDDAASVLEDGVVTIDVVANDSDPDGDGLTVSGVTQPPNGSIAVLDAHRVVYTPHENFHGGDTFDYLVSDPFGGTTRAHVAVEVISVNDAPVATGDTASLDEDTAVTVDVVNNDFDLDRDPLSIVAITQPSHGLALVIDAHHVSYIPVANYHGPDALTYTISDGNGGQATAELALDVASVNDAPVAVDDAASLDEDTAITFDVVANDSDVDLDSLAVIRVAAPAHGSATIADARHIAYTPAANYHGPDALTYTISDGHGGEASATLALEVASVNDTPVAIEDAASLDEDTAITIDVIANDSDVDGDALSVASVAPPLHGTAVIVDDRHVQYTPAANYHGSDRFAYAISDGHGGAASASVELTIASVNDAPVAADGAAGTFDDTPVAIALSASDADQDPLTFAITGAPAHGTLSALTGDHVTYTPAAGFTGSDAFSFTASDGQVSSPAATVAITVTHSVCGNGVREGHEECDDGNTAAGDGCEASCTLSCGSGSGADRATVDPVSGHCFVAFDNVRHSYQDAAALCLGVGGHLPTLTSASEDAAAFSAVGPGDRPWLGGDDIALEGVFQWTTGEPFGFTHFQPGKPDNASGADCLQYLPDGRWSDESCAGPPGRVSGTLCELELVIATPAVATGGGGTRSVAVADLNGDGYADIAALNPANQTVGILLGNGAGGFVLQASYPTGTGPTAIAAGDFDADGHVDLAIVNAGGNTIGILLGAANASFTAGAQIAISAGAAAIATGDFDRDGALDLVVGATNALQVLRGDGSGGFAVVTSLAITGAASALAVGDFDHDGGLDVAVTTPQAVQIAYGSGGGLGAPTTLASTPDNRAITAADLDGDGNLDLAVVSGATGITLWFGSSTGAFSSTALAAPGAQLVAAGDFDGDGQPDLAALAGGTATVFHGAGRTFTQAGAPVTTGGTGASFVVAASLNGDAAQDLVVANATTATAGLLLGGPGGFVGGHALAVGTGNSGTVSADFNEDGIPDLAVVDPVTGTIAIFLQTPGGALVAGGSVTTNPSAGSAYPVVGDFNHDGHVDLAVANVNFGSVAVAFGLGTGAFDPPSNTGTSAQPRELVAGDFDGDGNLDLAVASATTNQINLLINNGGGGFGRGTNLPVSGTPTGLVIGDFNGDGNRDLAVATLGEATVKVLIGHGDKTFTLTAYPIDSGSQAIAAGDLDGDGVIDLVAANLTTNTVSVLHGTGGGNFGAATSIAVGTRPVAVAAVDLDGDGHLDLVVGNAGSNDVTVLHNDAGGGFAADRFAFGSAPSSLTVVDLDRNGRPDITAASNGPFVTTLFSPR